MRKAREGFTLIELLVAVILISMTVTILYTSFQVGIKAWQHSEIMLTDEREIDVFYVQIERELRSALPFLKRPFTGSAQEMVFPTEIDKFDALGSKKSKVTVAYQVKGNKLIRIERPLRSGRLSDQVVMEENVLEGLHKMRFQYLFLGVEGQLIWRNEWPNDPYLGIPRGVRVVLSRSGRPGEQAKDMLLPSGILTQVTS